MNVGDYVMILNSTTQPSVDGIHRVTKLGTANEPQHIPLLICILNSAVQVPILCYYAMPCLTDTVMLILLKQAVVTTGIKIHWHLLQKTVLVLQAQTFTNGNVLVVDTQANGNYKLTDINP